MNKKMFDAGCSMLDAGKGSSIEHRASSIEHRGLFGGRGRPGYALC
ncbi:MAG: hypothetical protein AB1797_08925 [bacterium]